MLCSPKKNTFQDYKFPLFPKLIQSKSQAERIQEQDRSLEESLKKMEGNPSLIQSKAVKKRNSKKERSTFWPQQLKKIIESNKLTINISENSNKQDFEELRERNFGQLQTQLVRESVFQYYKELNQKIGGSEDLILKQCRLQQQSQMKFKLDPQFKVKIRKNIYQKQGKQNKRSNSTLLISHTPYQIIKSVSIKSKKQNPKARLSQKFFWRKEKWKLTDFFNSIVSEQEKANELAEQRRLRIQLATKLNKLDKKCEQLQKKDQRYLLDTFSNFNQKVNDKLCKKQRRLSKVKFIMRNGPS